MTHPRRIHDQVDRLPILAPVAEPSVHGRARFSAVSGTRKCTAHLEFDRSDTKEVLAVSITMQGHGRGKRTGIAVKAWCQEQRRALTSRPEYLIVSLHDLGSKEGSRVATDAT